MLSPEQQASGYRPRTTGIRPQAADHGPQTTDFRPQASVFRHQAPEGSNPSVACHGVALAEPGAFRLRQSAMTGLFLSASQRHCAALGPQGTRANPFGSKTEYSRRGARGAPGAAETQRMDRMICETPLIAQIRRRSLGTPSARPERSWGRTERLRTPPAVFAGHRLQREGISSTPPKRAVYSRCFTAWPKLHFPCSSSAGPGGLSSGPACFIPAVMLPLESRAFPGQPAATAPDRRPGAEQQQRSRARLWNGETPVGSARGC